MNRNNILLLAVSMVLCMDYQALADVVNPQISKCQEINDRDMQSQFKQCSAHVGCNLMMGRLNTCSNIKAFLTGLKNVTGGRKKIDSSDVFDAVAPTAQGDAEFLVVATEIKRNYARQANKQIISGKDKDGSDWVYEGGITKGKRNGTGVLLSSDGIMFRGEFVQDDQTGKGDIYFKDGTRSTGNMTNRILNGKGIMRFNDGARYAGEFRSGQLEGMGVLNTSNGGKLEGNFHNGRLHGRGSLTASNGNRYEGQFVNGERTGQATMTWANGERYVGEYLDGKRMNGIQYKTDGTEIVVVNEEAVETRPSQANQLANSYDQKINAAREECQSSSDSCETKCAGLMLLSALAKSGDTGQHQQCINECESVNSGCVEKVSNLEKEKQQALAPKPVPASPVNKPAGGGSNGQPVTPGGSGLTGNECLQERSLLVNAAYGRSDESARQSFEYYKDMSGNPANFEYYIQHSFNRESCVPIPGSSDRRRKPNGSYESMHDCYWRNYRTCLAEARYAQIQAEKESPAGLGPIKGQGGDDPADIACFNSLKSIEREFERAKQKIPKDSVVVLSEATMWMIAQSVEKINKQCPKSRRYMSEAQSLQKTYQDTKRVCDASASSPPCKPRLPGKEPVAVPQVSVKPLPPLKDKPKQSCGKPPSANAVKCLEEECAKQEGKLSLDKDGCAHCNTRNIGNYWFICPSGMGGAR